MTKDQKQLLEQEIINTYGKPEWDWDRSPLNDSAKRIKAIRDEFFKQNVAGKRNNSKTEKEQLDGIVKESKNKLNSISNLKLPEFNIDDSYLKAFDEMESNILTKHFNYPDLSSNELAIEFQVTRQKVSKLLNEPRTKVLEARLFESLAPWRTRLALLRLIESNDSKTVLRLAEHFKLIQSEEKDVNITSKGIDDPKATQMLKELGDKLIDNEGEKSLQ